MLKQKAEQILTFLTPYIKNKASSLNALAKKAIVSLKTYFTSWWQIALAAFGIIVFLYYPLGGWLIHKIDTTSYQAQTADGKLGTIDTISYLINREVHYKIWTPNLPFVFPSYFLDNMPAFQKGIMSSVAKTAHSLDGLKLTIASDSAANNLSEGASLLQYPADIWLFSPKNKLIPAPSSPTQYKKGRKKLNNFNREVSAGKTDIARTPDNLSLILYVIKKDLNKNMLQTEKHIRENSSSFFDFKSDDVFYFSVGKLYAYEQILNALGIDFKPVLIKYDIYSNWVSMTKALENATKLAPMIIRNAQTSSSFAPNHLVAVNYYNAKALNSLNAIINKLKQHTEQ